MPEFIGFFDGSITHNPGGDMGIGCVLFEVSGSFKDLVFEHSETLKSSEFPCTTTVNIAECLALDKLLSYLMLEGMTREKITIYGDSQIIINRVKDGRVPSGLFSPFMVETQKAASNFININFEWVRRDKNTEADILSKVRS